MNRSPNPSRFLYGELLAAFRASDLANIYRPDIHFGRIRRKNQSKIDHKLIINYWEIGS